MRDDIRTIMWKEWRGFLRTRERRLRTILVLIVPIVYFGIVMPWQAGDHWFSGFPPILSSFIVPILVGMLVGPDSFAGERERKTLHTLLASRMSDRAILWGKIAWCLATAWGMSVAVFTLGLVAANFALGSGFHFYSGRTTVAIIALSGLFGLVAIFLAIPVSLRASTVQEASQMMAMYLLMPPTVAGPIVLLLAKDKPQWSPRALLANSDPSVILAWVLLALAIASVLLYRWASRSFQRSRLIVR